MKKFEGYQKGINLGGWLSQCVSYEERHFNEFITKKDIETIANWGFDHVRLPIDYDIIENEDASIKESGHKHIEDCIRWCQEFGLKLILDLHKAYGFMFDKNEVPDPDKFFTNEDLQNRFFATWNTLIERYGKYKDMMAFELLNEVVNPDFADKWNEIALKAINLIRAKEAEAYILVGGVCHNNVNSVSKLFKVPDKYIVYNFHCYEPLCFTHQHASWVENIDYDLAYPADIEIYREKSRLLNQDHAGAIFSNELSKIGPEYFEMMFKEAVDYANENGVPLYCGEYGVIDKASLNDSINWLKDITLVFEKNGIGRSMWNYKEKDFGLTESHYDEKRDEIIRIINNL